MNQLHELLVILHIVFGSVALALFWVPAIARKGSKIHVSAGRYYVRAMTVVVVSALIASIMVLVDPIGIRHPGVEMTPEDIERRSESYRMFSLFLLMLSVLVYATLRHGVVALRARTDPAALSALPHKATTFVLGGLGAVVGAWGLLQVQPLLVFFAAISLFASISMYRECRLENPTRNDLLRMHFGGLIGSGIGAHTAFFAFGGSHFLGNVLPGQWQLLPWILPSVVGILINRRLDRRYENPVPESAG